jgi:molecular chaperone GrpE (heat shock protein)
MLMANPAQSLLSADKTADDGSVSVNSAFYRKLTQQIVQKDNIIKLLRLQVEDLNNSIDSVESSGVDSGRLKKLKEEISRLEGELEAERLRFRTLLREEGFTKEEKLELLEKAENFKRKASSFSEECVSLRTEVLSLKKERDDLTHRLVNLSEDYTSLRDMETVSPEDMKALELELEQAKASVAEMEAENKRLHRRLLEARNNIESSAEVVERLTEKLETANRKLESLPDLDKLEEHCSELEQNCDKLTEVNTSLKSRLNTSEKRLDEVTSAAASRFSESDWRILSGVIQMYDAIVDLSDNIPESDLERTAFSVLEALKLKKINSVGTFYNSAIHKAVETVYTTDYKHDLVIGEKSSGYEASGAVIKSAEVIVANNPYWCEKCERAALDKSQFCNNCGGALIGTGKEQSEFRDGRWDEFVALGRVSEKAMDFEGAYENYQRALEGDSCNRDALRGVARIEELRGNWRNSLAAYDRLEEQGTLKPSESRGRRRVQLKLEINKLVLDIF